MRRCHLRGHKNILKRQPDSCGRVQSEPNSTQVAGGGHAARAERPCWAGVFTTVFLSTDPEGGHLANLASFAWRRLAQGTIAAPQYIGSPPSSFQYFCHGLLGHLGKGLNTGSYGMARGSGQGCRRSSSKFFTQPCIRVTPAYRCRDPAAR